MQEIPPHRDPGTPEHEGHFMHEPREPVREESVDRDLFGNPPKKHRDWSHRRGEPRVMALFWMIYLMGATVVMFISMSRAHTISPEITRPAARMMLMISMLGLSVLWPMARLSQHHPGGRHVLFVLRDVLVLFVPLQAAIWPQVSPVLAHWPIPVVASVSLLCACWLLLLAGVLSLALASVARSDGAPGVRMLWMGVILGIVLAAPIFAVIGTPQPPLDVSNPRIGWLLSPYTGLLEIVRDRNELGVSARVFTQQIRMLIAIGCVGLALLLIARALEVARARVRA